MREVVGSYPGRDYTSDISVYRLQEQNLNYLGIHSTRQSSLMISSYLKSLNVVIVIEPFSLKASNRLQCM